MGTPRPVESGLADALFTRVQQRVLGLVFGQADRELQSAELIRLAGSGTGAVHRELSRLAASGLVTVRRSGNQKFYQANRQSPVFDELQGLIVKTVGLAGPISKALAPIVDRIEVAFVFGSVAKGTDTARSDIDLMILSNTIDYASLFEVLQEAESMLHRPVSPNVMKPAEWRRKLADGNPFVSSVNAQPRIFIVGGEDDLVA